jgi:zinc protease
MNSHRHPSPPPPSFPLPAIPPDVTVTTLDNGLTIILREDHSAPVVSAQAWCRTGSIHEGRWLGAGLSHVLEHMLFKGTTTRGPGRIDQEIQDVGGHVNAYTSFDRTVYWINVPSSGSSVAIDILCDIMQHATLPSEELSRELDVIRREMAMNHDDPGRRSSRRLFETAYTQSSYRFTIIGYPDIFSTLTPADILAYYHERYTPNNVFLVIVGYFNSHDALLQIRNAYSQAKARPLPPLLLPIEPPQTAPRETIENDSVELGHLHVTWHIPDLRHPDVPILDVLASLLGTGRSSRLQQAVLEKQGLVHSVDSWTYNPGQSGLLGISAVLDGSRFTQARTALLHEIKRLQTNLVPSHELRKGVKQFLTATLATRKTMQGQAHDLGASWLAANDLNFSQRYLAAVRQVKPSDLRRVANQYLSPDKLSLYALLPPGCSPRLTSVSVTSTDLPAQLLVLPNQLRLLLKQDHRLPFVQFRALFTGGVLAESESNNGASQLLARMLLKGTRHRTREQIATEIEALGGSIDTYGANHSLGVSLEILAEDFTAGLNVLADVILHPTFPKSELSREKIIQCASIKAQRDHLLKSAALTMRRALFGPAGYGLDPAGSESSVNQINPQLLRAFHHRLISPDNCVIAVYGDVNPSKTSAALRKAFHRWLPHPHAFAPTPAPKRTPGFTTTQRIQEFRDKQQSVLMLGFPGARLSDPERFALELIQEACSDLGSRLFLRIREKLGLAYYVGAQNFLGLAPGFFAFYAGTNPDHAARVERELLEESRSLAAHGLTEIELRRAKAKILGQKKIARQDLGHLAMTSALDELYGLGYANQDAEDASFEAVSLNDIRSVAAQYLQPAHAVLALIHPQSPPAPPPTDPTTQSFTANSA